MSTLGKNIRRYRLLKNLTQQKLGELLGFSARTISDWECNNTEPGVSAIKELIKVLDITYDELFDY